MYQEVGQDVFDLLIHLFGTRRIRSDESCELSPSCHTHTRNPMALWHMLDPLPWLIHLSLVSDALDSCSMP